MEVPLVAIELTHWTLDEIHFLKNNQCWQCDLSLKVIYSIHLRTISQEILMNLICNMCLEITLLKLSLPEDNELTSMRLHMIQWGHYYMIQYGYCEDLFFNTLRLRQYGLHFADDLLKWIFLKENIWISSEITPKFVPKGPINDIPALVQKMAWHGLGDKPLSEPMMT